MSIQPRFSSPRHSPIYALATFLDQLLRPLFDKFSQSTRLTSGVDFIQKLQHYTAQADCLTASTRFVTFRVHNLSTRMAHANVHNVVSQFLAHQIGAGDGNDERLSSTAVAELIRLVLSSNQFTHEGTVYRFVKGGPTNLPLMQLLADIYLQDWQRTFVRQVRVNQGFFGRYFDTGILTWNGSTESLAACVLEMNAQYPDIAMTTSTGFNVHFLHCFVENQRGCLYTRVHHDPREQLFLLPYAADHPRLTHRQWFRFALARAGQYCSHFDDFQDERLRIELTFLANGYSLDFVKDHLRRFFQRVHSSAALNSSTYASFRSQLFHYFNEQKYARDADSGDRPACLVRLHYAFDWGARGDFNKQFRRLWSTLVDEDPALQQHAFTMILNTKHCHSSDTLLAHSHMNL